MACVDENAIQPKVIVNSTRSSNWSSVEVSLPNTSIICQLPYQASATAPPIAISRARITRRLGRPDCLDGAA